MNRRRRLSPIVIALLILALLPINALAAGAGRTSGEPHSLAAPVCPVDASIDLEQYVNGEDADVMPGPEIPAGAPVTWTYKATNTGLVSLHGVTVGDDELGIVCKARDLAPGESLTCEVSETAVLGPYRNRAKAGAACISSRGHKVGVKDIDYTYYQGVVAYWLTILHNNDGESQVVDAGAGLEDFGGAARFKTVVDMLKAEAISDGPPGANRGVVMVSSGDNFLAGPEFNASLDHGVPFYDTIAMELIGYDAINLGNHDFDFGPDVLAAFLDGYTDPPPPYVSANLDFSGEPALQAYVDAGVIVPSTIIESAGELIGVIGLETPTLPFVSSPRNVVVSDDLVNIVQGQIDALKADGVNKIILASHLQDIANEVDLATNLEGLDVIISGGGDELLANPDDLLLPGDAALVYGPYPIMTTDLSGDDVPVVTTSGEYRYVGKLVVGFDALGNILAIDDGSGPVRVASGTCNGTLPCDDAVTPDPAVQAEVVDPVEAYLADLATIVIGTSAYDLDGRRDTVRGRESNEGNLITDALFWHADLNASVFGVNPPDVAVQNGGGIRNNTIIPAGPITALDTFGMVPFPNFVSMVESVPRDQFKEIMENAVACTQPNDAVINPLCGTGRFAQISGFNFTWSASGVGQILDLDGNVTMPGTRIQEIELDDGTLIVSGGAVVPGPALNVVTLDFLAKGGDQYPFRGLPFVTMGATQQLALQNFIETALGGSISDPSYAFDVNERIFPLP